MSSRGIALNFRQLVNRKLASLDIVVQRVPSSTSQRIREMDFMLQKL